MNIPHPPASPITRMRTALGRLVENQRAISGIIAAMLVALPFAFFLADDSPEVADADSGSDCSAITTQLLENPGFEEPAIPNRTYRIMHQNSIPGWSTTASDRRMEFWSDGFQGVPAFAGRQFAELNANRVGTVYQDITTIPGSQVTYTAAHRGRSGVDVFDIQIGPPAGPLISQSGGAGYADDNTAWGVYTDTYVVPAGQTVTRFAFASISSTGSNSYGNFLDITHFGGITLQACPDTNATYADTDVDGSAFGNDASIDDLNLDSYGQPSNGSVVMRPDGTYTYTPAPGFTGIDSFPYTVTDNSGNSVTTTVTISVTDAPLAMLDQSKSVVVLGGGDAVDGSRLRYTVTTTNVGNDAATGSVVRDLIPVGTSYVSDSLVVASASNTTIGSMSDDAGDDLGFFTGSAVGVNVGSGADATNGGTLAPGDTVTIQFDVLVVAGTAPGEVTNTASAKYVSDTLGTPNNSNSDPVTTTIAALADLSVTKSASPDPIVAGDDVTYTVTVSNAGPSAAENTVVTDALPDGVAIRSATPSIGVCTVGTTTCTIGTLGAGSSATVTYVLATDSDLDVALLANTADVTTTTNQTSTANDTVTITTPVATSADLSVTKSASPDPLVPGADVTWTITVTNDGPSTARAVTIADTLPAEVDLTAATPSTGSCSAGTADCALGDLAAGATATVTVVGVVDSGHTETDVANTVVVGSDTDDPDTDDNTATATSSVAPSADLVVTKIADTSPIVAGSPASWTYTIRNDGPSDAVGATSADVAPGGVDFTSASTSLGTCTTSPTDVICDHGTIPAGASVTVQVSGDVAPSTSATGPNLTNAASAATSTPDSDPSNDIGSSTTPVVADVELQTTKTATPDPVIAGSALTYSINVTNLGPSEATGVTVGDVLPDDVTLAGAITATSGSCSESDGTVSCTADTLAVDDTIVITIPVSVASDSSGPIINTATVDTDQTEPQTPTWTSTVAQQADIRITKTGPETITAGESGDWTFTVVNGGPSDATGIELTDVLPDGFSIVSTSDACTAPTPSTLSCSWAALSAGQSVTVTATLRVDPGTAIGPVSNSASVSATTPTDPSTDNNTSTAITEVERRADVSITKAGPETLEAGRSVAYALVVSNAGPSSATATTVTDLLPDGLTFDTDRSDDRCTAAGALVTCVLGELAPGATTNVQIGASVSAALVHDTTIENSAQVSTTTPDPNVDNDRATTAGTVVAAADLDLAKVGPTSATAGSEITWTVTLTNLGPADAIDATVSDAAPTGVVWTSITPDSALLDCDADAGTCSTPDGVSLPAGSAVEITYVGEIDPAFTDPSIDNTATVASTTTDPEPDNNSETVTTPVGISADLAVAKIAEDPAPVAGTETDWTITVTNVGPSLATDVELVDLLPAGVTFVELSPSAGLCELTTGRCELGDIAVGATITIGVTGLLDPSIDADAELVNTASVEASSPDPTPDNDIATAASTAVTIADLAITKTATTPSAVAGGPATWLLEIVNLGPSDADDVVLADGLPLGVVAASVTASTDTGSCTVADGDVTCDLETIPLGGVAIVTIAGDVASSIDPGVIVENTASVSTSAIDPTSDNDESTDSIGITASADVSVVKSFIGDDLIAGASTATWEIVVSNNGPSDAADVVVSDELPDTASAVSITSTAGLCDLDAMSCELGVLADGATEIVTVTAQVASDHVATLGNTATVVSDTPDPDPDNDISSTSTPVATSADLVVDKVLDAPITAGTTASWTITVTNRGPSIARDVVVDDTPSISATAVQIEADQGSCDLDGTCDLGDLAVGQTVSIAYAADIDPDATEPVGNTATASSTTDDPSVEDNTASVTSPVATSADLAVDKVVNGPVVPGAEASWTITVVNNGPSTARNVIVEDVAPDGVSFSSLATAAGTCTLGGVCELGELGVGEQATIAVTAPIDVALTGMVTNTATVSGTTPDPLADNDVASVSTPASMQSELTVTKEADETTTQVGTDVTWSITVTNEGPSVASDVIVTEQIPDGLTLLSATPEVGTWDDDLRLWSVGELAVGETVALQVVTDTDVTGVLTNVATASSSTPVGGLGAAVLTATAVEAEATVEVSSVPNNTPLPLPFTGSDPIVTVLIAAMLMLLGAGMLRLRTVGASGRRR